MEKENQLQIFNNEEFGQVRTVRYQEKDYFVATDVARALGYKNPNDAILRHCKGYVKHAVPTESGEQQMNVIPEGDMYRLIVKSKLPSAEKFESWVMDDVLPTLRKTGTYSLGGEKQNNELIAIGNNILEQVTNSLNSFENKINDRFDKLEEKQEELEDYYKPTHKKKLGINSFIKSCLGDNATKENVTRATEQLLFLR